MSTPKDAASRQEQTGRRVGLLPISQLAGLLLISASLGFAVGAVRGLWAINANDWFYYGMHRLAAREFSRVSLTWIGVFLLAALALFALRAAISLTSASSERQSLVLGISSAVLSGAGLATAWAYHLNRYQFRDYWRRTALIGSWKLPEGLVTPKVLLANAGIVLVAAVVAILAAKLAIRYANWHTSERSRGQTRYLSSGIAIGLLVVLTLILVEYHTPNDDFPNIVLISVDTLRADHLGCYGYPRPTSPHIDELAADGVVFEQAISQANHTLLSHMAIITSQIPDAHGVLNTRKRLPNFKVTLAEILQDAGYSTGGFTGGYNVDARFGFDQGFQSYEGDKVDHLRAAEKVQYGQGVRFHQLIQEVTSWLESRSRRPFFLFLHGWDTHAPYLAHEELIERFSPGYAGDILHVTHELTRQLHLDPNAASEEDRARIDALYDNEIRYVDETLGEFLAALRRVGHFENTIVVLTSDHGDELLEHGMGHSKFLYDPEIHVPLILRFPDQISGGVRVGRVVRSIDIVPTVLDLAGVEPSNRVLTELQGRSLVSSWSSENDIEEVAISQALKGGFALRTSRYKYIRGVRDDNGTDEELYDLLADPEETHDLSQEMPEIVTKFRQRLEEELSELRDVRNADHSEDATISDDFQEKLRALGYLD